MRDVSFLAPPAASVDWRLVVAYASAADAGVLTALPADVTAVAERCGLDPQAVRAVLELLEVWGIVTRDEEERYSTGPHTPTWPDDAMLVNHAAVIRRWSSLLPARLRDRSAETAESPARSGAVRLDTLATRARRLTGPVLDRCFDRFPDTTRVLDLGGGHGEYSLECARRGLRATLQDLPGVVEEAERRDDLRDAGVELFAGDMHRTLPPGPFDLVLCATVTNLFDAERNRDLYRRLRPIIAPGGGLAIVSYLRGRDPVAAAFAVQMLVFTDDGDAHGQDDYQRWLTETGYRDPELHDLDDSALTVLLAER